MNLLIGFVILLCLVCSEINPAEHATDLWTRIFLVGMVSLTAPGLALFQTWVVSHRMRDQTLAHSQRESIIRRSSICHSAVWLTASLAIVWAVRWQDVVRANWNLDRWPLLDELMLLAPVVLSWVASWAIFYDHQRNAEGKKSGRLQWPDLKQRFDFVSLRFQVYFLMVLIPITITIVARDLNPWLTTLTGPTQSLIYLLAGIIFAAGFPFLLMLIWKNHAVPSRIRDVLVATCRQHRLRVYDVRIWETSGRIVNAVVAGVIPWCRIILISDRLVGTFPTNELLAVVRHEAGHLRLWHLPIRMGFTLLPLFLLGISPSSYLSVTGQLDAWVAWMNWPAGSGLGIVLVIYAVYLGLVLPRIARRMEFEADLYSCLAAPEKKATPVFVAGQIQDMSDALVRLASLTPHRFGQKTLMHPSMRQRVERLHMLQSCPKHADEYLAASTRHQRMRVGVLFAAAAASSVIHFT